MFAILTGSGSESFIDSNVLSDIGTLLSQIMTWITGNRYLVMFFTLGLVAVGIGVFKALKRAVRG